MTPKMKQTLDRTYQSVRFVQVWELVVLRLRPPALPPRTLLNHPLPRGSVQPPQRGPAGARRPAQLHYTGEVAHGLRQLPSHEEAQKSHHITGSFRRKYSLKAKAQHDLRMPSDLSPGTADVKGDVSAILRRLCKSSYATRGRQRTRWRNHNRAGKLVWM